MPKTKIAINSQETLVESGSLKINGFHSDFSKRLHLTSIEPSTYICTSIVPQDEGY